MACPKCGLPEELCICETIAKEKQQIKVGVEKTRFNKKVTTVKGIDPSNIDINALLKKLKTKLACGGTYKNNKIELQGDHRKRIKDLLVKEGFPESIIQVK